MYTQVTEDDVRDAYRLWHDALSVAAADEEGRLDMNLLSGGTSGAQRQFMEHVLPDLLRGLLNGECNGCSTCCTAFTSVQGLYAQGLTPQTAQRQAFSASACAAFAK
jgi:hypothetical protein